MPDLASRVHALFPPPNPELIAVAALSFVVLVAYYYGVQSVLLRKGIAQNERQKSWVLTAFSSAVTTMLSAPFVVNWYWTGNVLPWVRAAEYGCVFFVAYLVCDLAIGSMHYRSSISFLTGWFHHFVYILLICLLVLPHNFSSLFSLCFILELPTFLLAIGNLSPRFRNDYLFATVFFLTRIAIHIHIAIHYGFRAYRSLPNSSWVPSLVLTLILPMHVLWMRDCVSGILRRRAARLASLSSSEKGVSVVWPVTRLRTLPTYLLSRPLVVSALDVVRARRLAFRRSRQRVVRALQEALQGDAAVAGEYAPAQVQGGQGQGQGMAQVGSVGVAGGLGLVQAGGMAAGVAMGGGEAPRWRSIRRRVVGRIRRTLPETYGMGVVQIAEGVSMVEDSVVAAMDPAPIPVAVN